MASEFAPVLLKLVLLLAVAKIAGEAAERLKQPAVLGELLAGILLGPSVLGLAHPFFEFSQGLSGEILHFVAEVGVIFLLFEVGLETKLKDMVAVGKSAFLVALLGIVGSFVAGFGVSWLLGAVGFWSDHVLFHVFIGATFTATSVGITARVLSDLGRLATAEARIILGAAVLDDVGGLLILAVVLALAGGALEPVSILQQVAIAVGFLVVALVVGLRVLPWTMDRVARARVRGIVLASGVAFAFLLAYLADLVGLATIVGAFTAGLILASTRQQHVLSERVRHVGDVFVPFFFVFVGLQVDLTGIAGGDVGKLVFAVALLTAVAILGKLVAGWGVADRGLDRYAVGVGMVPRGEVGLIFALYGLQTIVGGEPLMEPWEYAAILLVVALTTFVTPVWLKVVLTRERKATPHHHATREERARDPRM